MNKLQEEAGDRMLHVFINKPKQIVEEEKNEKLK